jgi:uncharacterized protein (DUF1778 family)
MTTHSPRITAKVSIDTQELLSQAAAMLGMSSISSFVLSAAIEKAKKIMETERLLKLSERDAMLLVNELDAPAQVNPRLRQAARHYDSKTQS